MARAILLRQADKTQLPGGSSAAADFPKSQASALLSSQEAWTLLDEMSFLPWETYTAVPYRVGLGSTAQPCASTSKI